MLLRQLRAVRGDRAELPRLALMRRLQALRRLLKSRDLSAIEIDWNGDCFLRTEDGVALWYNVSNPALTAGDGQSLDLHPHARSTSWEHFLFREMRAPVTYVDVGANNGYYYTLRVALRHRHCRVVAFEPDPKILQHLRRNVVRNAASNVEVVPMGLADTTEPQVMTKNLGASNFLVPNERGPEPTAMVACTTLDHFVARGSLSRIDLIKVDIEGAEFRFLRGARNTLLQDMPLVHMELDDRLLSRQGASEREVVGYASGLGYTVFRIRATRDVLMITPDRVPWTDQRPPDWLVPLRD